MLIFHIIICRCESRLLTASTTTGSGWRRSGLRSVALFGRRGTAASQPRSVTTLCVPGWPPPHPTSSPNHYQRTIQDQQSSSSPIGGRSLHVGPQSQTLTAAMPSRSLARWDTNDQNLSLRTFLSVLAQGYKCNSEN